MNNDLKNILSNSNKDIDNQQLMDYISNHITKADSHHLEENMADDPFVNDAVEGLQQFKPTKDLQLYVEQLNNNLQKQIAKNKKRKEKHRIKDEPYTYFAIIFILLLLVLCYVVLKKNNPQEPVINKATTTQLLKPTSISR